MRKMLVLWGILCLALACERLAFADFPDDGVAAMVNGETITQKQVLDVLAACYGGEEEARALNLGVVRATLEEMVMEKVLEQKLRKSGITATTAECIEAMKFYEEPFFVYYKVWAFKNPVTFRRLIRDIMKNAPETTDKSWETNFQKAWEIIDSDRNLKKFLRREVYQKYHVDPQIFREKIKLFTRFQKFVEKGLQPGDVEKFAADEKFALEDGKVKLSHILLYTVDRVTNEKYSEDRVEQTRKRIEDIGRLIKQDLSNFEEIARAKSEDDFTKFEKGEIGWIPRWTTPTLFGAFMLHVGWIPHWTTYMSEAVEVGYRIPPGKFSRPIKTSMGYHLVVATQKEEGKALAQEALLQKARERLVIQRMEKQFQDWLAESQVERRIVSEKR